MVTCEVIEVKEAGIEVKIADTDLTAFIRRSDLSRDRSEQRPERFAKGEKVDARVTNFDKKTRKITVSIKALEIAEEKEAVAQYGSTDSGASLGDILGAALKARQDGGEKAEGRGRGLGLGRRPGQYAKARVSRGPFLPCALARSRRNALTRSRRGFRAAEGSDHDHDRRPDRRSPPPAAEAHASGASSRFVALAVVVVGALVLAAGRGRVPAVSPRPQIARVTISRLHHRRSRRRSSSSTSSPRPTRVKGVIVAINSTGGATAGGEALYEGLRKLAAKKPTVATIGTVGASAAYMAAIATDHIVARRTSITGSIGVLFDSPEVSELLDKLGVSVEEIKSAPLKAEPSPFKPASPEAKAVISGIVADTYDWFVDIVAERRDLARADALALADGRIFTGRQALAAKLIDEIGGEEAAIDWLATKGVDRKLPVKDWKRERSGGGLFAPTRPCSGSRARSESRRSSSATACSTASSRSG